MAGDYLWMLQIILECLAIVCNIAGLITIHSYHKKTNQNIILGYLSTAQILFATALLVTLLRERYDASILLNQIAGLLNRTSGISLLVGMYALTIDRMVCIINPIKYKSRISRKKTKLILLVGTIVIFILCTSSFLASYFLNSTEVYLLFGVFVFQVVFVILAAVTYSISFYKVLKARKTYTRFKSRNKNDKALSCSKYHNRNIHCLLFFSLVGLCFHGFDFKRQVNKWSCCSHNNAFWFDCRSINIHILFKTLSRCHFTKDTILHWS